MTSFDKYDTMEIGTKGGRLMEGTVSWSQIRTWTTCRQKWYWLYRVGIVPKRMRRAPSIGSCGHVALAAVTAGTDWEAAVDAWLQEELAKPMFDEEVEEYHKVADLVRGIIPRYIAHYQDTFEPVVVERRFDIPVSGVKTRLVGYWDAIVKDRDGKLWLKENKMPQHGFRTYEDLILDGQIGVYQWAARRSGFPVVGTIFDQLLAKLPAEPSVNKDGSLSRAKVYTDWETYKARLLERGLDPANYAEMEDKLSGFEFFKRDYIYRPPSEVKQFTEGMQQKVWELSATRKRIYRCDSFINCSGCDYRELCIEQAKGRDVQDLIEMSFEPRQPRKEEQKDDDETTTA